MIPFNLGATARLSAALQLPPMTTDVTISIPAGGPADPFADADTFRKPARRLAATPGFR